VEDRAARAGVVIGLQVMQNLDNAVLTEAAAHRVTRAPLQIRWLCRFVSYFLVECKQFRVRAWISSRSLGHL
jgi:hypothetical protein